MRSALIMLAISQSAGVRHETTSGGSGFRRPSGPGDAYDFVIERDGATDISHRLWFFWAAARPHNHTAFSCGYSNFRESVESTAAEPMILHWRPESRMTHRDRPISKDPQRRCI